jgi:hypothetical protein
VLSGDSVATVLHAIATGFLDRAVNVVAMSDEIGEAERAVLWGALNDEPNRSEQARRFGDALRSLGASQVLVNEAYRTAFYSGEDWQALSTNPLFAYFVANRGGTPLDKWVHYFPIYDRHLARYRGTAARVLEVGVYRGGGLDLLRHYLGADAYLVGIDIDPTAAASLEGKYPVEIGDQADGEFLRGVVEGHGPFDVVIDDGGHTMTQQIASVEALFPVLKGGGTYLVEDCHTSYWPDYADPDDPTRTFIGWAKDRIDDLHAYHHSTEQSLVQPWQTDLAGIHAYDSVVVFDKERHVPPFSEVTGTNDYIMVNRLAAATGVELLATRDVALRSAREAEARIADVNTRAEQAAAQSNDELRILRAELVAANQGAAQVRSDLDKLREELEDTNSKLLGSWGIIQEMRKSRSWQLTAPIRRMKSIIRRR